MELKVVLSPEEDGLLVRQVALKRLHMSYGQFKRAKFEGQLLADGVPVRADYALRAGQRLTIVLPEGPRGQGTASTASTASTARAASAEGADRAQALEPLDRPLAIPYQDPHFWIVDKPAPLPASVSTRKDTPTLENVLLGKLGCPAGYVYRPVNRLDKGTSGLMAVAMDPHAQQLLQRLLHTGDFQREYLAVCEGVPLQKEGTICLPIAKADGASIRRVVTETGKPAVTHYQVIWESPKAANASAQDPSAGPKAPGTNPKGRSLLWLRLETGRTHQIRVHMQAMGCPVVGDFLYGTELKELPGRFALHSCRIGLRHPITGEWIEVESPLPPELEALLER